MNTPEYWSRLRGECTLDPEDVQTQRMFIAAVQKDAFVSGLKRAIEIVSLRISTPKNEAYTAAIEEVKVFLGAEIERGGQPAYCVCQNTKQKAPTEAGA